ncbi:MAG: leucine-rich repeat domain-containing protein [Pseudohongiellaceae bacterium]
MKPAVFLLIALALSVSGCGRQYSVSINNRPVYDPAGTLNDVRVADADLQGCINFMASRMNTSSGQLTVLSCPNSNVQDLSGIEQLSLLRFLDLGNNNITSIEPVTALPRLSVLNVEDNPINDITLLATLPGLTSVNLSGVTGLRCSHLDQLQDKLGNNLIRPVSCD